MIPEEAHLLNKKKIIFLINLDILFYTNVSLCNLLFIVPYV